MSESIPVGGWQRTEEYHTRGVPVLHGVRWRLPLCVEEGIDPRNFYPQSVLQQDGILYVVYFAENGESACCAIEAQSGTLRWRLSLFDAESPTKFSLESLVQQDGILYIAYSAGDFAGNGESACCAIEAQSGTLRWRFTVADRSEDLPTSLREAVADQSQDPPVLLSYGISSMVLAATIAFVGTTYGVVYGLDLSSGQLIWKMDIDDLQARLGEEAFEGLSMDWEDSSSLNVLAVVGNLLLMSVSVESEARGICVLDIVERTCLWHERGLIDEPLTLWGHMLYGREMVDQGGPGGYVYYAYDLHRQQVAWHSAYYGFEDEKTVPIEIATSRYLPISKKTLYVIGCTANLSELEDEKDEDEEDDHDQLIALDAETGEIRWTYALDEFKLDGYDCDVTVANGLVYLSQGENRYAIDLETHQLRWHHQQRYVAYSSPVLADGLWYEYHADGVLLALDALTGQERWTYRFEEPLKLLGPLCLVDDGSVYVIAGTTLYALH